MKKKKIIFISLMVIGFFLIIFKDPLLSLIGIIMFFVGLFNLNKKVKKGKVKKESKKYRMGMFIVI